VASQSLQYLTVRIEDMYFSVVERNDNVIGRQVKRRDDALVGRYVPGDRLPTGPPCRLDHVPLLEMGFISGSLRPPPLILAALLRRNLGRET
jgi:hypothetical protein